MRSLFALTKRNLKETVRDPLSAVFCLAFPLIMLTVMQLIFNNFEYVPDNFLIQNYAAGICVFGYTFTALFVALQISADKNTSFVKRINISPIGRLTYIASYLCSALPVALAQTVLFFLVALIFGYKADINFLLGIIYLIPSAVMYICFGILFGSLSKNEKQTGPLSSIFISLTGIFGGVFMPVNAFGGGFATFVNLLPFAHSVQIAQELHTTGAGCIYPHVLWVLGYAVVALAGVFAIEKVRERLK